MKATSRLYPEFSSQPLPDPKSTVVIIEDDPDIREAVRDLLELEGYFVASYENGKEALEHIHECPEPGVILLDLMMPVMNGWEFLRARKQDPLLSEIPCYVVSAVGNQEQLISEGAFGVLQKPIDASVVLDLVETHMMPPTPPGAPTVH